MKNLGFIFAGILFAHEAVAQTILGAPGSTTVTASPAATITVAPIIDLIQPWIHDLGGALLLAITGWIGKHVRNAYARQALDAAVTRGAQGVYESLVAAGKSVTNIPVKNAAIAVMTNDIVANMPTAMKILGVTPDAVSTMVKKSLGGSLAADPTVTISPNPLQAAVAAGGTSSPVPVSVVGGTIGSPVTYGPQPNP